MINKKIIALTMGDPSGISTELIIKCWKKNKSKYSFFIIHDPDFVSNIIKKMKVNINIKIISSPNEAKKYYKNYLPVYPIYIAKKTYLGTPNNENSKKILESIDIAVKFAKENKIAGIVTNPVSKKIISKVRKNFTGHTEYLAQLDNKKQFVMMLFNKSLKVVPVTTHVALKNVSKMITPLLIANSIKVLEKSLKNDFKIKKPKIAVTGLNPHSGDGGMLGHEENKIIIPAIIKAKKNGLNIEGPLAADSVFRKSNLKIYDAFLCMYHDQALIAVKTIDFEKTVNYTVGLSFIRTSPDHGTGFDIAKKFIADETSLVTAINYAGDIANNKF